MGFYYPSLTQQNRMPIDYIRPVTSIDEVKAASISFDGSIFYFPDVGHNCIYTKQINLDGTSTISIYQQASIPVEKPTNEEVSVENFITREELNTALAEIKNLISKGEKKNESSSKSRS